MLAHGALFVSTINADAGLRHSSRVSPASSCSGTHPTGIRTVSLVTPSCDMNACFAHRSHVKYTAGRIEPTMGDDT